MANNVEEQLSAFVDGELTDHEMNAVLANLRNRAELRERWARYHLISDGIHRNLPTRMPHDLRGRVARALEREPVVMMPPARRSRHVPSWVKQAAGVAVAASVTAVAIIGFQNFSSPIALPWTSAAAPAEPVVTADNDLAPYLLNHNESVAAAGYGMLPYVRLVSHADVGESE
jgi:sigma-E factor negative regulatory protein RseA